ncbi:hypothetical protein RKD49_007882 [Streptomyces glaucescens]
MNRASDEDIVALLHACRSARDRLIVLLVARVGLRVGQLAGLRRCDAHLMVDSRILGCDVEGPHLHVVRRQNPNAAWSRSRSSVWFRVDFLVVQAFDQYVYERHELLGNDSSDFLLVNLFPPPPPPLARRSPRMRWGNSFERLRRRAKVGRHLTPHIAPTGVQQQRRRCRWLARRSTAAARPEGPSLAPPLPAPRCSAIAGRGRPGYQPARARRGDPVNLATAPIRRPDATTSRAALVMAAVDEGFLTSSCWDPDARTIVFPQQHPQLGWPPCRVQGCGEATTASTRLCSPCGLRWKRDGRPLEEYAAVATKDPRADRLQVGTALCRVPGCQRIWRSSTTELCTTHEGQQQRRRLSPEDFIQQPGIRPLAAYGPCSVIACGRQRQGTNSVYCSAHAARLSALRRKGLILDEDHWRRTEPPVSSKETVSLRGLPDLVTAELLFGLQERTRSGRRTAGPRQPRPRPRFHQGRRPGRSLTGDRTTQRHLGLPGLRLQRLPPLRRHPIDLAP